jgi:hypothetical protein
LGYGVGGGRISVGKLHQAGIRKSEHFKNGLSILGVDIVPGFLGGGVGGYRLFVCWLISGVLVSGVAIMAIKCLKTSKNRTCMECVLETYGGLLLILCDLCLGFIHEACSPCQGSEEGRST